MLEVGDRSVVLLIFVTILFSGLFRFWKKVDDSLSKIIGTDLLYPDPL